MSKLASVSDASFRAEVLDSSLPVLVDFWAEWCGPCHMVAPEVEAVAEQLAHQIKVVKLDIDSNPHSAQHYGVMSIPTMVLFKDGEEAARVVGARPRDAIRKEIEHALGGGPSANGS